MKLRIVIVLLATTHSLFSAQTKIYPPEYCEYSFVIEWNGKNNPLVGKAQLACTSCHLEGSYTTRVNEALKGIRWITSLSENAPDNSDSGATAYHIPFQESGSTSGKLSMGRKGWIPNTASERWSLKVNRYNDITFDITAETRKEELAKAYAFLTWQDDKTVGAYLAAKAEADKKTMQQKTTAAATTTHNSSSSSAAASAAACAASAASAMEYTLLRDDHGS
jgi:hypothetical protein